MASDKEIGGGFLNKMLGRSPTPVARALQSLRTDLNFPKDQERKIKPDMDTSAVLRVMTEGSYGKAREACEKILEIGPGISAKDPLIGIEALAMLDALGIRGTKIDNLYRACGEKLADFLALILAVHDQKKIPYGRGISTRILRIEDLQKVAEPKSDTGGVLHIEIGPNRAEDFIELSNIIAIMRQYYPTLLQYGLTVQKTVAGKPLYSVKPPSDPK